MRFILNGMLQEDATLKLFKGADGDLVNVRVLDDTGEPNDCTGDTVTVELYASKDRNAAAVKSIATSDVDDALGALSFTPTPAIVNFGPGTYYAFLKHVAGSVTTISANHYKVVVG